MTNPMSLRPNIYVPMAHRYEPETVEIIAIVKIRLRKMCCLEGYDIQRMHYLLDEQTRIREAIIEATEEN